MKTLREEYDESNSVLSYVNWLEEKIYHLGLSKSRKFYEPGTDHPNGVLYETQDEYFGR